MRSHKALTGAITLAGLVIAAPQWGLAAEVSLDVTVTAYNSVVEQTNEDPRTAAWGDELEPGMKVIAVSRDLLSMGLRRGTKVRIEGMPGEFVVLDKMNRRWERRIDVYMGEDVRAARRFGKQDTTITWDAPEASPSLIEDTPDVAAGPRPEPVGGGDGGLRGEDEIEGEAEDEEEGGEEAQSQTRTDDGGSVSLRTAVAEAEPL